MITTQANTYAYRFFVGVESGSHKEKIHHTYTNILIGKQAHTRAHTRTHTRTRTHIHDLLPEPSSPVDDLPVVKQKAVCNVKQKNLTWLKWQMVMYQ